MQQNNISLTPSKKSSLGQMTLCRWKEFRREPSAFFFVLLMPVVWMLLLGASFSGDKKTVHNIGMLDTPGSKELIAKVELNDMFELLVSPNRKDLEKAMIRGKIDLLVSKEQANSPIRFEYDQNNSMGIQARYVLNESIQNRKIPAYYNPTEDLTVRLPGSRYIDFLIPGLVAMSLLTTSLFGTGMIIVSNRRENLLKRYLVTPVKAATYIYSHMLGRFLIMLVEIATTLSFGYFLFSFNIHGPFAHFMILALFGTAAFTSIAICFGARSTNTGSYNGMTNLFMLPVILLSGAFFSRSHFPDWLETLSTYLPLTALVDGFRIIALEGSTLTDATLQLGLLIAYLVGGLTIAKIRFRWY